VRVATVAELQQAPGMSHSAAEAVVRYFQGDSLPSTVDSPQLEQTDVAEDAAAAELEVIASEEEAAVDPRDDEEE
jgi:hypothetical protein